MPKEFTTLDMVALAIAILPFYIIGVRVWHSVKQARAEGPLPRAIFWMSGCLGLFLLAMAVLMVSLWYALRPLVPQ